MNTAQLSAVFDKHKHAILGGGAAVVAALGYRSYRRGKQPGAATTPTDTSGAVAPTGAAIAGYTTPTADTTGTDVYNALQPQMQQTQTLLSQLIDALGPAKQVPPATGGTPTVHTGPVLGPGPVKPSRGPIKPKPSPTTKTGTPPRTYTVRKGDTLSGIAARYRLPWTTLYAHNKAVVGKNPNLIYAGQHLVIP